MARNNNKRASTADAPFPTQTEQTPTENNQATGNGFSFPLPTEVVELPSKGVYYKPGTTLHGKTEIEIKYMTAKEEDILTSPHLAKKGLTLDRLLESIVIDKSLNLNELLVGDRNALLMAARITGYGNDYSVSIRCSDCGADFRCDIDLDEVGFRDLDESEVSIRDGVGYLTLPVANIEVGIRPVTVADENRIEQITKKRRKHNLDSTTLTDLLRTIVVSAAGVEDRTEISSLIEVLPAKDSRAIRKAYKAIAPDLDLHRGIECTECGHMEVREVPIDAGFFWPDE